MHYGIVVENYRGNVRVTVWESPSSSVRGVQVDNMVYSWEDLGAARLWVSRMQRALVSSGFGVEVSDWLV